MASREQSVRFLNRLANRYTMRVSPERANEYVRGLSDVSGEAMDDRALDMITDASPRFFPSLGELRGSLFERWQEILDSRPTLELQPAKRKDPVEESRSRPPDPQFAEQARAQVEALIAQCGVPFPRRRRSSDDSGE